jgi:aromatic-L-amino-acid decarboxylase
VCFRYRPGAGPTEDGRGLGDIEDDAWAPANEQLMARVNSDGTTFLSHTRLRGRLTLRLAIGNLRTTRADVQQAWQLIQRLASELPS